MEGDCISFSIIHVDLDQGFWFCYVWLQLNDKDGLLGVQLVLVSRGFFLVVLYKSMRGSEVLVRGRGGGCGQNEIWKNFQ